MLKSGSLYTSFPPVQRTISTGNSEIGLKSHLTPYINEALEQHDVLHSSHFNLEKILGAACEDRGERQFT
eukprot:1151907-Pelagomonas_calceolata.AAC.2